jgi:hypothetical protein
MLKSISFVSLAEKLGGFSATLHQLISVTEDLTNRGIKAIRQRNHSVRLHDENFKADFNKLAAEVKKFASGFEAFRLTAAGLERKLKEKKISEDNTMALKTFVTRAREVNYGIEEFESVFNYFRKNAKDANSRLDWWGLEVSVSDILRLSGKILFTAREISKLAERQ